MEVFLLVLHLLIALALVGIVLLQPSEGGALGQGQGPGGLSGMMQGRSAASALTRATVWLGAAFFATSITLTLLAKSNRTASPLQPAAAGQPAQGGLSTIPIPDGGLLGPAPATAPAPGPAAPAATPVPAPAASTPAPAATPPAATQPAPASGSAAPASPAAPAPAQPQPATP